MKKNLLQLYRFIRLLVIAALLHSTVDAQVRSATVKVNSSIAYQKITGFGGFVNSPQFGYNHMSEAEIRKMWGANSEAGYNIMRMYIPSGETNWQQVIPTAQLAKSLGIKIFASPWSMPTQWKTDNIIGSVFTDEQGVKRNVYLKEEHYADYANYLNNFVLLLRNNGVELDAISIQNEPDYQVDYAGCIWTTAQLTKFLKENRQLISCKVIAPETVGMPDNYANALNAADVLPHFDIFGGHQYGSIQTAFKNLQAKGKEAWMTEFLINWNSAGTSREFNWSIDAFDFAGRVNEALLANVNAWIHYATKRYYGMMGDGTFGIPASQISKRGRVLSHYARFVTGATRVETVWNDNSGVLKGSSYLSSTGDSIVVVVINSSANSYNLAADLPFLTRGGKLIQTISSTDMVETAINLPDETNRPKVVIAPSSIATLVFVKAGALTPSQMTGKVVNYQKIDSLSTTNAAFANGFQLSGKTVTFKVDVPLISANQNANNGYLKLNGKFNRLVFSVENITSAGTYTSANTTLYYVNNAGLAKSYNYGTVTFDRRNNFDWALDISENVLTDGCQGILGIYNSNYNSILTLKLNNVFVAIGNERGYQFTGPYSKTDGYLLDCLDDISFTSLDFTMASGIPANANWDSAATNKNCVYYVAQGMQSDKNNVVAGNVCGNLTLRDMGGDFYPPAAFTTAKAQFATTLNGYKMLVLPFNAPIPANVKAYNLNWTNSVLNGTLITTGIIPANTPVLVNATGSVVFEGTGSIMPMGNFQKDIANGIYVGIKVPIGAYYLQVNNNSPFFRRATTATQPSINSFDAYLVLGAGTTAETVQLVLDDLLPVKMGGFTAAAQQASVQLNWNTFTEVNNEGFAIERSSDGQSFEQIGFIKGKGNNPSESRYDYEDRSPAEGVNYYRLKQVDRDGHFVYSVIRSVQFHKAISIKVYPNPASHTLVMEAKGQPLNGLVSFFDATGRVVMQVTTKAATVVHINIAGLASGTYFYRLNNLHGSFTKK